MAERTNPHANLIIGAQDEASPVFDKIKASSQSMAAGVEQAAAKAAGAVGGMGDKAAPAAQKLDSVTSSMIRQVQRLNAELEAGSARNAAYFEKMANIKGADTAALAPYLADLKKAEAAQRVATTGLDQMGMSAKQTTAALRQVPMQFTDIVVSLQGGQSAMQVFLQQGGQLKDMFGGAGNAARALGGYVIGLVNPFTVAAAAVAGFGLAMASVNSQDAALLALSTQLTATGRASAGAVGEIKALVKELNLIPGVSKASATAIITEFAKVNGIGSDLFKSLGSSVADFAAATGTDLPTAAKKLADAFADPAKGAQVLEGALGTLTAAQILTIEKMAAMGDKSGAQVAMMDALKQATEGLAKQGMTPLGEATDKMSNAWDALTSSIGNSEAFRTANSWLATLIEKVAELTVKLSQMKPPTWLQYLPVAGPAIGALRMASGTGAGSRSVSGVVGTWDEGGATGSWGPTASETEQQVKAAIAATRGYETQAAAMEKLRGVASQAKDALKELESQNRGGSVEAMRLRDSIAAMNEKLADMGKKGAPKGPTKETISEYDKLIKKLSDELPKAAAEAEAAQMGYNKAQTEFLALAGSDVWAKFSNSQRATVAALFENKIASEQAGDAAKTLAKANLEAAQSREKYIASLATGLDKIQADIAAQIEATQRMGLSKEAIAALDAAKLEMLATDLELQAIKAMDRNLDEQTYDALKKQAQAYRDLAKAKQDGAAKETMVESAKTAADEWKKTAEQINQSLTDALMRGFESGKDFAKNLRDTVINMFKTMVLRPVISAIVNPVAGAVTGMMGLSGAANASTGGASMLGNVGGLLGAGSSAFGIGASYGATSLFANGLGSTLSAGSSMIGAGSTMSGLGTIAGALGPIALGIGAIYTIAKSIDDSGTYHTGGAAQYNAATGLRTSLGFRDNEEGLPSYNPNDNIDNQFGTGFGYVERGDQTISAVSGIAQALGTALDGVAVAFGQKAGYEIATAFADDTSKDGAWGALRISKDGQELLNWEDTRQSRWAPREFGDGEEGYKQYLAAVAKDTRQVLLDMDLPSWADTMLESIGDAANMDQLSAAIQQIGVIQTTFVQLGKTMEGFAGLTDKAFEALMRASGGFESLAANAGTYYENFYSEAEKTAAVTRSVSESLAQVGLAMPATRDEFRALVESQLAMGEAGAEAVAALLGVSGAFASVTAAAVDASEAARQLAEEQTRAAKAAQDAAYDNLRRAIDRDRSILQDQASMLSDTIGSIADAVSMLKTNARELYGTVDSTAQMLAAQGMVYIENALSGVRAGGSVADYTGLSDAIGAARSGIDSGSYATQFDRERDALVLAGQLSELGTLGDAQLSIEERQLRAINEQLEYLDDLSKRAEAMVSGTAALTGTVQSYFDKLLAFLAPSKGENNADGAVTVGGAPPGQLAPPAEFYREQVNALGGAWGKVPVRDAADVQHLRGVKAMYDAAPSAGYADLGDYFLDMRDKGVSMFDIGAATGHLYKDIKAAAASFGIPAFAGGGMHSGGLRLVGERGPELEATGPSRIWNQQQLAQAMGGGQNNQAELIAEVRALREEVAGLRAAASAAAANTAGLPQMVEQFDTVAGNGVVRTKATA